MTDYWPSLSLRNRYSRVAGKVLFSGRLYLVFFNETKPELNFCQLEPSPLLLNRLENYFFSSCVLSSDLSIIF